jgi:hypothetical protein
MDRVEKLAKIKSKKAEQEQRKNKFTAKLDVIKESLSNTFDVSTIKQAEAAMKAFGGELEKLRDKFDGIVDKVEEEYDGS